MEDAIANAAEVVAGILGIAVTVVAIVVELAATRYNHRITGLFVRDWRNLAVLGFFVATTGLCLWVTVVGTEANPRLATITMVMVAGSLLALLPYFIFVFAFISPISILERIAKQAARAFRGRQASGEAVVVVIDELADAATKAIMQGDRTIAVAAARQIFRVVDQFHQTGNQTGGPSPSPGDPDLLPLTEPGSANDIGWLELKAVQRLLVLFEAASPKMRVVGYDLCNELRSLLTAHPHLAPAIIRTFNSFLRASINVSDPRSAYYVMHQYRLCADVLSDAHTSALARHLRFYGQLAYARASRFCWRSPRTTWNFSSRRSISRAVTWLGFWSSY